MKVTRLGVLASLATVTTALGFSDAEAANGISSINTGRTIMKVRTAKNGSSRRVIASTYEGMIMNYDYNGNKKWAKSLSGYMNHDLWCEDITGDGKDEIIAACANGTVYCLNPNGTVRWEFKKNDAPMYAVTVVRKNGVPYVVCGGFDKSIYYVSSSGDQVKEIPSSTYSDERPWGRGVIPPKHTHVSNFLRRIRKSDRSDVLLVLGSNNHMQVAGTLYQFKPLANLPFSKKKTGSPTVIGDLKVVDPDGDGKEEVLMGTSAHQSGLAVTKFDPVAGVSTTYPITRFNFGYRVVQPEFVPKGNSFNYLFFAGSTLLIVSPDMDSADTEKLECDYSFNDIWKDPDTNKIIMASAQSGGSCFHVLDTQVAGWKDAYTNLNPPGKIRKIIRNTNSVWNNLNSFDAPSWERDPLPVYLMTESIDKGKAKDVADNIIANYSSPVFLGGTFTNKAENWNRSGMGNEKYKNRRDGRRKYTESRQDILNLIMPWYNNVDGVAYWGGHGNDPYMFHIDTTKKILDRANGKKTVLIYPELEDHSDDFAWVLNDLFYPLADHAATRNGNIFVRTKHAFWQGNVYLPMWNGLLSGEHADVFVPAMEETTDKSMELSLAGRMGVWTSGAVNNWGARTVPDNPSFDRSRQHSHQMLPNNFLRTLVYSVASGATYLNNFPRNPDYMSLVWELIAKGALYVPKRDEIMSFSPVHLSMTEPDEHYMTHSSNVKWSTFYDQEFEENNPFVFSRLDGSWPAAVTTKWDFSRYAAGVKERRQNFLPPYNNGMVLITPPQKGPFADTRAARGKMTDHLHPMYKNIMKEYYTDGRNYYSADGSQTYGADEYYRVIENDIKENAKKLPLTVSGSVAWVTAQTSPNHLRLTLVDGGYINPSDRNVTVTFNTVKPIKMTDLLDGTTFDVTNPAEVSVKVPCGLFRFIDIEIDSAGLDDLSSVEGPVAVGVGQVADVIVDYSAAEQREIHVDLISKSSWKSVVGKTIVVEPGSDSAIVQLTVPSDAAEGGYKWNAWMAPVGANWSRRLDKVDGHTVVTGARIAESPQHVVNGLAYQYYEGSWNKLPDFSSLTPVSSGTVRGFDMSPKAKVNNFGFAFMGFVDVPVDGEYTFFTTSDDGSQLYIGSQLVVDNDGLHAARERSGKIKLKAGKHAITTLFFEKSGGETLIVKWKGPGIGKQKIPASKLFR